MSELPLIAAPATAKYFAASPSRSFASATQLFHSCTAIELPHCHSKSGILILPPSASAKTYTMI
jgi:hypothetical protein